ncbi:rhomboid family intramembrane serine protease [Ideonella livida]|uniref:Rhomboid family intramembrane serine protease n=1 Tax=Ideonella livida TaxID=2707176 RepID=A0A7C9TKZ8_9BURK|nr:rhomboid family intramembrane serine protease [Ideonella livida]NDY91665.1 rhomboid family intramembrane serine protease [Ideonella livida]
MSRPPSPARPPDLVSRGLVGVCLLLFLGPLLLWLLGGSPAWTQRLHALLALPRPSSPDFHLWQPLTYAFIHGGWIHLLFNVLGLWLFAPPLEEVRGRQWLLETFLASVLWAGIVHVLLAPWLQESAVLIGASGGLYGLMVAFALHFPEERLPLLPGLEVKARTLALVYGGLELYLLFPVLPGAAWLDQQLGHVAHLAHLGGMLGGLMLGRPPATGWPPPATR